MKSLAKKVSIDPKDSSLNKSANNKSALKHSDTGIDRNSVTIKVFCRLRPHKDPIKKFNVVNYQVAKDQSNIKWPKRSGSEQVNELFPFTKVFDEEATQEEVYLETARKVVDNFVKGFNCSLLAYGQTGAGKTYTMEGNADNYGLIPKAINHIFLHFDNIKEKKKDIEMNLFISVFEIYAEKICDLLTMEKKTTLSKNPKTLKIRADINKGFLVDGLSEFRIESLKEAIKYFKKATKNRTVGSTDFSEKSSRSHMVCQIWMKRKNKQFETYKESKLFLMDLAGSEKATNLVGDKQNANFNMISKHNQIKKETKDINTSQLSLRRVIETLSKTNSSHIPYRSSVLTAILKSSLQGNSMTSIILNQAPEPENAVESYNTLLFGRNAFRVKNIVQKNKTYTYDQLLELIEKLKRENRSKDEIIKEMKAFIESIKTDTPFNILDVEAVVDEDMSISNIRDSDFGSILDCTSVMSSFNRTLNNSLCDTGGESLSNLKYDPGSNNLTEIDSARRFFDDEAILENMDLATEMKGIVLSEFDYNIDEESDQNYGFPNKSKNMNFHSSLNLANIDAIPQTEDYKLSVIIEDTEREKRNTVMQKNRDDLPDFKSRLVSEHGDELVDDEKQILMNKINELTQEVEDLKKQMATKNYSEKYFSKELTCISDKNDTDCQTDYVECTKNEQVFDLSGSYYKSYEEINKEICVNKCLDTNKCYKDHIAYQAANYSDINSHNKQSLQIGHNYYSHENQVSDKYIKKTDNHQKQNHTIKLEEQNFTVTPYEIQNLATNYCTFESYSNLDYNNTYIKKQSKIESFQDLSNTYVQKNQNDVNTYKSFEYQDLNHTVYEKESSSQFGYSNMDNFDNVLLSNKNETINSQTRVFEESQNIIQHAEKIESLIKKTSYRDDDRSLQNGYIKNDAENTVKYSYKNGQYENNKYCSLDEGVLELHTPKNLKLQGINIDWHEQDLQKNTIYGTENYVTQEQDNIPRLYENRNIDIKSTGYQNPQPNLIDFTDQHAQVYTTKNYQILQTKPIQIDQMFQADLIDTKHQDTQTRMSENDQNLQTNPIEKSDQNLQVDLIDSQNQDTQTPISENDQNLQTNLIEKSDQISQVDLINPQKQDTQTPSSENDQNLQTSHIEKSDQECQAKSIIDEKNLQTDEIEHTDHTCQTNNAQYDKNEQTLFSSYKNYDVQTITPNINKNLQADFVKYSDNTKQDFEQLTEKVQQIGYTLEKLFIDQNGDETKILENSHLKNVDYQTLHKNSGLSGNELYDSDLFENKCTSTLESQDYNEISPGEDYDKTGNKLIKNQELKKWNLTKKLQRYDVITMNTKEKIDRQHQEEKQAFYMSQNPNHQEAPVINQIEKNLETNENPSKDFGKKLNLTRKLQKYDVITMNTKEQIDRQQQEEKQGVYVSQHQQEYPIANKNKLESLTVLRMSEIYTPEPKKALHISQAFNTAVKPSKNPPKPELLTIVSIGALQIIKDKQNLQIGTVNDLQVSGIRNDEYRMINTKKTSYKTQTLSTQKTTYETPERNASYNFLSENKNQKIVLIVEEAFSIQIYPQYSQERYQSLSMNRDNFNNLRKKYVNTSTDQATIINEEVIENKGMTDTHTHLSQDEEMIVEKKIQNNNHLQEELRQVRALSFGRELTPQLTDSQMSFNTKHVSDKSIQSMVFEIKKESFHLDQKDYLRLFESPSTIEKLALSSDEKIYWTGLLIKINRYSRRQFRRFVITNKRVINIGYTNLIDKIKNVFKKNLIRRSITYQELRYISLSDFSCEFAIHVPTDHDYRLTASLEKRSEFIYYVMALHERILKKRIKIFVFQDIEQQKYTKVNKEHNVKLPDEAKPLKFDAKDFQKWCEDINRTKICELEKTQIVYQRDESETNPASKTGSKRIITQKILSENDFEPIRVLSVTEFGTNIIALEKETQKLYAIKIMEKSQIKEKNMFKKIAFEKELQSINNNPFLASLEFCFHSPSKIYFGVKYFEKVSLKDVLDEKKKFNEEQTKFFGSQILLALEYLHKKDVLYRDLKLENIIMLENCYVKLVDFGLCKKLLEATELSTMTNTTILNIEDFHPPEGVQGNTYSKSADCWCFGVLLYQMVFGKAPSFDISKYKSGVYQFSKEEVEYLKSNKVTTEFTSLLRKLFVYEPSKRIGHTEGTEEIKKHPWFSDVDFKKIFLKKTNPPIKMTKAKYSQLIQIVYEDDTKDKKIKDFYEDEFDQLMKKKTYDQTQEMLSKTMTWDQLNFQKKDDLDQSYYIFD